MRTCLSLVSLVAMAGALALAPGCSQKSGGGGERIGAESSYDDEDDIEPAPDYETEPAEEESGADLGDDLAGEDDVADDLSGADVPAEEEDDPSGEDDPT